jgi:general secretion pathway protein J
VTNNSITNNFGDKLLKSSKDSAGFTLLELMISISIMGIIIIILMGVLRLGLRSVEAGEKKIAALERVRAALTTIEFQIQSALPLTHEVNGETKHYFKGERTSLEFSTNTSIWEGDIGYSLVSYRLTEGDGGKWALLASESRVGQGTKREIKLLDRLDDLYFEYFYKDPTAEQGKWVDQWTDGSPIPEKIQLHWTAQGKALALIIPMKTGWTLAAPGPKKKL